MRVFAILLFVPLQALWLPLSLIGVVLVGYRQLIVSKRLGVSQTAVEILNGRWTMDVFGLREDIAARKLASSIPNNSVIGLWLSLFPLWAVQKLLRVRFLYPTLPDPTEARFANLVPSRTVEFDALLEAHAPHAEQLVILGAGLDTRAYSDFKSRGVAIYEVDEAANQAHKRAALDAAGIESDHVRFVVADFEQSDWIRSLLESDYNRDVKTIFLWEGVTLYLPERAVAETLRTLTEHSAPGSVALTDIYAHRILKLMKSKAIGWSLEITGEATAFGLDFSSNPHGELSAFASSNGTRLNRHQFLGAGHKNGAFVVIAEFVLGETPEPD